MFASELGKGFKGMFASKRAKYVEKLVKDATDPAPPEITKSCENLASEGPPSRSKSRSSKGNQPDTERRRIIRREWPRDPKGSVMKNEVYGKFKKTPNNLPLWAISSGRDGFLIARAFQPFRQAVSCWLLSRMSANWSTQRTKSLGQKPRRTQWKSCHMTWPQF